MSIKLKIHGSTLHYNEHYLLTGLDVPDQHPIEAIIGLQAELDKKYVKPLGGIPASDLADTYVKIDDLNEAKAEYHALYAKCQSDCMLVSNKVDTNTANIATNTTDIFNLTGALDLLKNKVNSLPGIDDSFLSAICVKQKVFTATDTGKVCDIIIIDTNLKVIEPTVLKSDSTLAENLVDYTVSYPDDVTLRVTFLNNGTYTINYLSGEITDSDFDILLKYYKKLESELYLISGSYYKPAHNVQLLYDTENRVIKEIYTGNINKVIDYEYDANSNITKKTVTMDNVIKTANYNYTSDGRILEIVDDGTDIPLDGTRARAFNCKYVYDSHDLVYQEIYTGDINKTVTYTRNGYGDVIVKEVLEDGVTKKAQYVYDGFRKLINIVDDGTEPVAVVFHGEVSGGSGGTTNPPTTYDTVLEAGVKECGEYECGGTFQITVEPALGIDAISEAEIDVIFAAIFND
jgi:YD repeat-containing protein